MTLARYLARRRLFETLLVVTLMTVSVVANALLVTIELHRQGEPFAPWLPWALEGTSSVALLIVFPALLWFDAVAPLNRQTWLRSGFLHLVFSGLFSLGHVGLMYGMRKAMWPLLEAGASYHWPNWLAEFGYEYLKDFRTYFVLLALIYLYSFVLRRLQGEAELIDEGDDAEPRTSDRFLVKKLGREFLVRTHEIDWVEASGNYVNLHVGDRVFPLRGTMTDIADRLAEHGFQRVHRSAIVNLDRVTELSAADAADGMARLSSDVVVPVSRSYRKTLRTRLS